MTSTRAKKKKRAAVARNEAKKKAAVMLNPAPQEARKTASVKDAALVEAEALGKPARFVEARHAEVGQKLVTWNRRQIVEFTGDIQRKTCGIYSESIPGDTVEFMFKGWDMNGDETQPFAYAPFYPFRDDAADVARIMERFIYKKALLDRKMGKAAERREREAVQEIDETTGLPKPRPERKAGKPRGDLDPVTGVTAGSDGHTFGLIMLGIKPCGDHRKKAVEGICKVLAARMDAPKAKALAQSWYSTLLRKKPEIYGKLKVEETVEA